jgi:pilus assembly protein CpaB
MICILAVLFGLGGAYALRVYLKPRPQAAVAPNRDTVPVASLNLPAGRIITRGDIGLTLRSQMGEVSPHTMGNPQDIIGRVLREPLKPGEPFLTTNLYPEGNGPNLSEQLKLGLRAVTVPVDSLGTLGGHVRPGAIVDVLFRTAQRRDDEGFEEIPEMTVTLFAGVEVLAVGPDPIAQRPATQDRQAEPRDPMVYVTLACTPEQSSKLRAVLGHGEIALAMLPQPAAEPAAPERQPVQEVKQTQDARPAGVTLEDILGIDLQPKQIKTEIYRAGNRTTNVFNVRRHHSSLRDVVVDPQQIPPKATPAIVAAPAPATGDAVSP